MTLRSHVNRALAEWECTRSHLQWRLMQTGLPALLVATEAPDALQWIAAAEYALKSPWRECLANGTIGALLAEAESYARAQWD